MSTAQDTLEVVSPCIGVCELDEQEICTGCGRTLDDIACWSTADEAARAAIVARAAARQAADENTNAHRKVEC